ncbi:hypothetical protein DCAR_0831195 [Daucus carota subsp. sativus]|uniref:Large ribosomal subunit protein bL20c n=1 Tax=Daucus carota subsp. sativus TaxID=79200 RepID=A0AAF1B9T6_DAUCS|nr:hypothetical protein DCAR_0831195 [Daucus carota subsp. sativus]
MTRIRPGNIARRCRTKFRLFASSFRGAHSRLTRTITQQKIRALVSSHRDMDKQMRNFHHLSISNKYCLYMIPNEIIKEVDWKGSTVII